MANPDEGEVGFKSKGKEWTISFRSRELRALEKKFDKPIRKVLSEFGEASQDDLFVIFVQGLRAHHPDVKDEEADVLLKPVDMMRVTGEALRLAFGAVEDEDAKPNGAAGNPLMPSQETSTGSAG